MPFLSAYHVNRLEVKNKATVDDAPAGSNAVVYCREAGLLRLALVTKRKAVPTSNSTLQMKDVSLLLGAFGKMKFSSSILGWASPVATPTR